MKVSLWKRAIEQKLREFLKPFEPQTLYEAMSYYLFQEGKRIRPLFLCAVCDALSGNLEDAIVVGSALEMIHNYSLIHDDLPALDNDSLRRGKPTCHLVFGEDVAILAGDALLTYAFEVVSNRENFSSLDYRDLVEIVRVISTSAGHKGMVGGQVMDIKKLGSAFDISIKKTASLFFASFVCGGVVAKRHDLIEKLGAIGEKVGLLFQMIDDYKDRDGFYALYGEELNKLAKETHHECVSKIKELNIFTPEMEHLLGLVVSPLS